jgi:hypothetical protein
MFGLRKLLMMFTVYFLKTLLFSRVFLKLIVLFEAFIVKDVRFVMMVLIFILVLRTLWIGSFLILGLILLWNLISILFSSGLGALGYVLKLLEFL